VVESHFIYDEKPKKSYSSDHLRTLGLRMILQNILDKEKRIVVALWIKTDKNKKWYLREGEEKNTLHTKNEKYEKDI
jgi:hypothetical protein